MYFKKFYQFSNKMGGKVERKISLRVKFILSRILFMTVLLEVYSVFAMIVYQLSEHVLWTMIWVICSAFDGIFTGYCVYLMRSHNNDRYIQFIKVINKLKICCCFKYFINAALAYDVTFVLNEVVNASKDNKELTLQEATIPERAEIEMSEASQI